MLCDGTPDLALKAMPRGCRCSAPSPEGATQLSPADPAPSLVVCWTLDTLCSWLHRHHYGYSTFGPCQHARGGRREKPSQANPTLGAPQPTPAEDGPWHIALLTGLVPWGTAPRTPCRAGEEYTEKREIR